MKLAPKNPRRRKIGILLLLLLAPLTIAMTMRAQAQWSDYEAARKLYIESENSIHARDWPRAAEQLEEAVRLCPEMAPAWEALGWCYHAMDQKTRAYETMQRGCQLNPGFGELRRSFGHMYLRDERFDLAMVEFDHAARLDPNDPMVARLKQKAKDGLDSQSRSSAP